PDPEFRKKILDELSEVDRLVGDAPVAATEESSESMAKRFELWEQEAQAIIEKEISDPEVRAAIWQHHCKEAMLSGEFLTTESVSSKHSAKLQEYDQKLEEAGRRLRQAKKLSDVSTRIKFSVYALLAIIMAVYAALQHT